MKIAKKYTKNQSLTFEEKKENSKLILQWPAFGIEPQTIAASAWEANKKKKKTTAKTMKCIREEHDFGREWKWAAFEREQRAEMGMGKGSRSGVVNLLAALHATLHATQQIV